MQVQELKLRCFAEQESDGSWFAACIDLNLAAQGGSAEDVRRKLHAQIHDYIEDALTEDSSFFGDLIPRRAPISLFVRYHAIRVMNLIRRLRDHGKNCNRACLYTDFLPLKPV